MELSYRLRLRNPSRVDELLTELREASGVSGVTSIEMEEQD
jgi:hypothetical protein